MPLRLCVIKILKKSSCKGTEDSKGGTLSASYASFRVGMCGELPKNSSHGGGTLREGFNKVTVPL